MKRRVLMMAAVAAVIAMVAFGSNSESKEGTQVAGPAPEGMKLATFAGGCFWCMESPFEEIDGVQSVTSGYTGGHKKNPTYEEVCTGTTGHAESIQIVYDPNKVTYEKLLHTYWRNIDPTTPDRQFCDVGSQYRPEIFYHDEEQLRAAEKSKKEIEESGVVDEVKVRISPASEFYVAEDYHQNFYMTNPEHYQQYRMGCGRDRRLAQLWGESDH